MKRSLVLAIFLLVFATSVCLAAPVSEDRIAIYPGATRDDAKGKEYDFNAGDIILQGTNSLPLNRSSYTIKSYFSNASIEEVTAFYWKELGADLITESLQHPALMAPGNTSRVSGELQAYEPIKDIYHGEKKVQTAAWIKAKLNTYRKPFPVNQHWLQNATFIWNAKATDHKFIVYAVEVADISFDQYYQEYKTKTLINVHKNVFIPESDD